MRASLVAFALALGVSCGGTTGGGRVSFTAQAAGPANVSGGTMQFTNGLYRVVLTRARLHIGAVYLNQSVPNSGVQATACILPGIYVAQVLGSLDVDALSASPQTFPVSGEGNAVRARVGELWLTGGDVNTLIDQTVILDMAGTAEKGGIQYPFEAKLTISGNRFVPSGDPRLPNQFPICGQRIVSGIPVDLTPQDGGTLLIRINPAAWFIERIEFSDLRNVSGLYQFDDSPTEGTSKSFAASKSLYRGFHSSLGVYEFIWQ